jgi:excisionase family DNA binding protein
MSGPLLTARQVAELIGVSSETVLRWTRRGDLPAIRLRGGALRYGRPTSTRGSRRGRRPSEEVSAAPQDAAQQVR